VRTASAGGRSYNRQELSQDELGKSANTVHSKQVHTDQSRVFLTLPSHTRDAWSRYVEYSRVRHRFEP
jgi:hypothetical protein